MVSAVFDLYKVKVNIFLNISSFLAFEKIKEYITPCRRLQKGLKKIFWLILVSQSKFSEALRPRKEATLKHEILDLGPTKIWHNI